jgi:hypothetical protein
VTKLIAFCALTGLLAVAGCASQQQLVGQKEDLLAAAGFQIRTADNPQRLAAMRSLPPNKFVTRVVNGQPVYLYADPLVCRASISAINRTGRLTGRRFSPSSWPMRPK